MKHRGVGPGAMRARRASEDKEARESGRGVGPGAMRARAEKRSGESKLDEPWEAEGPRHMPADKKSEGERWNVPKPPSDPREEIAAHYGASGASGGMTGMARTFRGAGAAFLKERQSTAKREMEKEYAKPHPDAGVHNAYMAHLADMHNSARDELKRQAGAGEERPKGKYHDIGPGMKQMDQGGYTSPGDIKKFQKGKLPEKESGEPTLSRDGKNAEKARGPVDHEVAADYHRDKAAQLRAAGDADAASWHATAHWAHRDAAAMHNAGKPEDVKANASRTAQDASANAHAAEAKSVQSGERGGRFYVSATGAKVYVKPNPGAETVGHMSNQRFHMGLPMSVHLAEPKKNR